MPTVQHEVLVELFRNRPELAAELMGEVLGHALPSYQRTSLADTTLGQLVRPEYRADLVVVLEGERASFCIAVEVQRGPDPDKRYVWPFYAAALRARHRCPACVLVLATDRRTATWAARPIETGQPGSLFRPLVMGPREIPVVVDAEEAARSPELAVLSALTHGRGEIGRQVATTAMLAALGLDEKRATLYPDLVLAAVTAAVRKELAKMQRGYQFKSAFIRKNVEFGRTEGRAEGLALAILKVVERRGLSLTDEQRTLLEGCVDPATLEEWLERALDATAGGDVFR